MNDAETRAEHIDPALKAAGWDTSMNDGTFDGTF
jgi:type I site-specific restriction endonuclease